MFILLPANCNPFIGERVCRIAPIGFVCPGVDKHQCCTIYFDEGIARNNKTGNCQFKDTRKPVETTRGKKVNPLKQSKRGASK